jgi:hypothetical protein
MRPDHLLPFALVPAATVLLPTPAAFADATVRFLQATPGADQAGLTIVSPSEPELKLRTDGRAQDGKARVRVAHFARELGAPDLFVDGERVVQRFPYLGTTPYVALSPGSHTLAAMRPNSTSTLVSARVTLRAGTTSTAYVLGSGGQPTQALLTSDATGSPRKRGASERGAATSSRSSRVHVVRPGDTLWGIARERLGADASETDVYYEVQRLWRINGPHVPGGDPDVIRPGLRIHLS